MSLNTSDSRQIDLALAGLDARRSVPPKQLGEPAPDPDTPLRLSEPDAVQSALIQMNIGREISRRLRHTDELLFRARMGEVLEAPEPLVTRPAGL